MPAQKPEYVIYIGNIQGLDYIRYDSNEGLKIGALATIRTLEKSTEVWPIVGGG